MEKDYFKISGHDLLIIYRNYLFSLQEKEKYGDKYGDTDELIKMYEKKLKIYIDNKE